MDVRAWKVVCRTMAHHLACCPPSLLLLLVLTCQPGASATEQSETLGETLYGPSSVEIDGVDVVTVGILYGFQCSASCSPSCRYSWTRDNITSEGSELSLKLTQVTPAQTLTCTAENPSTNKSVTVQKMLQVTAGPSNLQIHGPPMLTINVATNFTCEADCYPSCSYSWTVVLEDQVFSTSQGNTISVTPPTSTVNSETLICEAQNTVSTLFTSVTFLVWVASVSDIIINGDSSVVMGKQYTFECSAVCVPSCNFIWTYMGRNLAGDKIQIPILHQGKEPTFASHLEITFSDYSKIEPLTCKAINTISQTAIYTTMNLTVTDPISVRPASKALPVSGQSFSLECVGFQNPASITWQKNNLLVPESERVRFSEDNATMTFSVLQEADDGLYQCVVDEGETPIQSVGFNLLVNYGPSSVVISGVDVVTVGILYGFHCSASCYPSCVFTWTWDNVTSQGSDFSLHLQELQPTQSLTCMATNPATGKSVTVEKTLEMTAGPTNMQIDGPAYLTAGVASDFTCSSDCYPSCNYTWTVLSNGLQYGSAQGNTITVTPSADTISETLVCRAQDTVSLLSISKSLALWVASLSNVTISGDSAVVMGKQYTFKCSATCVPSCVFTWTFRGRTFQGEQTQIPILQQEDEQRFSSHLEITFPEDTQVEPLTCEATNIISNATVSATMNLTVTDPFSVRPISGILPIAGEAFSLLCEGPEDTISITWLKNKQPILANTDRVRLSPDNSSVTFSPLLQTDGGMYQCLVLETVNITQHNDSQLEEETEVPIPSVGYTLQVNYGPEEVFIVEPNVGNVGAQMITVLGHTTELQCLTDCFPVCSISWFYGGALFSTNTTIWFTPETPPYESTLACLASNPVSKENRTAETLVVIPDGPQDVIISGPHSLEIGVTASFTCSAECTPSCSFTWILFGRNVTGSAIDITVNRHVSEESISCWAENTFNGKTMMVTEVLSVSDPHWCGC